MMTRRSNWPSALALFIEEKRNQPFDWQHNNCAFFVADWLAILTGVDLAEDFRARTDSALSAARELKAAGGLERIAEDAFTRCGWPESPVTLARRGDVVSFETKHGPALGVCLGARAAFAGPDGVMFKPAAECHRAWRIG